MDGRGNFVDMLPAGTLRSDGMDFYFGIRNREVRGNDQHGAIPFWKALFHTLIETNKPGDSMTTACLQGPGEHGFVEVRRYN
jgi:hypothetical protein